MENGNSLMIFEGNKVEVFEFNGKILFNPKDVGKCLELTEASQKKQIQRMNDRQVIKLKNSDFSKETNCPFRKLHNTGENFITESGFIRWFFASRCKLAEKFQDWVTDEVLFRHAKSHNGCKYNEYIDEKVRLGSRLTLPFTQED